MLGSRLEISIIEIVRSVFGRNAIEGNGDWACTFARARFFHKHTLDYERLELPPGQRKRTSGKPETACAMVESNSKSMKTFKQRKSFRELTLFYRIYLTLILQGKQA